MRPLARNLAVAALALAGMIGSILGTRALQQAMSGCENLYRVDTVGSQLESELEFETQESRRAFLYALATPDPNQQLPYIDESRAASKRVWDLTNQFRRVGAPSMAGWLDGFEISWEKYAAARDEIIADILEGNVSAAVAAEQKRGQPAFQVALNSLHLLKRVLESQARRESAQVDTTLKRCAAGLSAFAICTLAIVLLLVKANRARYQAFESLRANNQILKEARELEQQRAAVLEMVSTHAPLPGILTNICGIASKSQASMGAAIWAAAGLHLHFQVAANLPKDFAERLAQIRLPRSDAASEDWNEANRQRADLAARCSQAVKASRKLRDASGQIIGVLEAFAPVETAAVPPAVTDAVLDEMADLAAVAIDNTLLYERLAFQAQHDTLTELPNRMLFQDRVQQSLQLARRHRKRAALLWFDVDRFKQTNDTLGHRVGDEVLCEIARRLKQCLRESDTIARVGGDEFTVLVNDLTRTEDAELVCRKILNALARPIRSGDHELALTASAGMSIFPEHGEDPIVLLRHADLAMYSAKREGGNCFHQYAPVLGEIMTRRLEIERELKTAIEREEFSLHYQPLVNCRGELENLEALLRWTNPALGKVSPADFVPVAEEMGLIPAIGEWALRTACGAGARWLSEGLRVPAISVNVSGVQLTGSSFASLVERVLHETGFPACKLVLEITETVLMNNLEQALAQVHLLRQLGIRFAIDDFGTGYSSLSQLRDLPVDSVKIDRSFVKDLDPDGGGSSTLVRGIIALAHGLSLEVVAEGVETEQQLNLLRSMGCDISQGFFLYRPMPTAEVEKLMQGRPDPERPPRPVAVLEPALARS
jgi:diguanylate cyclase (GGDEF)-like protein